MSWIPEETKPAPVKPPPRSKGPESVRSRLLPDSLENATPALSPNSTKMGEAIVGTGNVPDKVINSGTKTGANFMAASDRDPPLLSPYLTTESIRHCEGFTRPRFQVVPREPATPEGDTAERALRGAKMGARR